MKRLNVFYYLISVHLSGNGRMQYIKVYIPLAVLLWAVCFSGMRGQAFCRFRSIQPLKGQKDNAGMD